MLYVFKLASLGEYVDSTFSGYDNCVVDAVISRDIPAFVPRYPLATSLHFHAANIIKNQTQYGYASRGGGRGRGRGGRDDRKGQTVPEGFPENICYFLNYGNCDGCNKGHVCRIRGASHKAANCIK